MTRGEWLVGVDFNFPEQSRLKALACEHIETAAMYAVKAVTKRMRPEPAGYGGM